MSELHSKLIYDEKFVPDEGQRDLECSNKESYRCPSFGVQELDLENYTEKELDNISSLCSTLKRIRSRLILEGHSIKSLRKELYEKQTG